MRVWHKQWLLSNSSVIPILSEQRVFHYELGQKLLGANIATVKLVHPRLNRKINLTNFFQPWAPKQKRQKPPITSVGLTLFFRNSKHKGK